MTDNTFLLSSEQPHIIQCSKTDNKNKMYYVFKTILSHFTDSTKGIYLSKRTIIKAKNLKIKDGKVIQN